MEGGAPLPDSPQNQCDAESWNRGAKGGVKWGRGIHGQQGPISQGGDGVEALGGGIPYIEMVGGHIELSGGAANCELYFSDKNIPQV
jgi:hypothetical protein